MQKRDFALNFVFAIALYLPTLAYAPGITYLIPILIAIIWNRKFIADFFKGVIKFQFIDKNFAVIVGLCVFAFFLRVSDFQRIESIKDLYSFAYLFPVIYLVARVINARQQILRFLLSFVLIEAVVCIVEYTLGVSFLFSGFEYYSEFEDYDLLYFTRVFGLSGTSSVVALKLGVMIMMTQAMNLNKKVKIVGELLLITASLFAFGRAVLLVLGVYYLFKLIRELAIYRNRILKNPDIIPAVLFILLFSINPQWTKKQFTRNNIEVGVHQRLDEQDLVDAFEVEAVEPFDEPEIVENTVENIEDLPQFTENVGLDKVDMSGRNEIWNAFLKFSLDHIWFGNRGEKFMIGDYHAHNSFLEILASFGVLFFIVFMGLIAFNINIYNWYVVIPILILALGQYVIFWGISLFDVVFYFFLFLYKPVENEN